MDKYAVKGAKKILSLTRTKIRLAEESGAVECIPGVLPLVKMLSGKSVGTVAQAKEHREELALKTDYSSEESIAYTVLQCMDVIEGVKYRYEPPECMSSLGLEAMKKIDKEAKEKKSTVNILLLTKKARAGINLYIGNEPPEDVIPVSVVPTSLAGFIAYAFDSDYLSHGKRLRNVSVYLGHRTLIVNAIYFSLGKFGATLSGEPE
ncbi:MAG: hypothetical protein JW724_04945 [Candidatus Altiarchaeota archaeon]|nr:hypothetical protein [Candidatus Altiarchaeota archaeon]